MSCEKVAIYCRLSVEDVDKIKSGDDSESIQNQKLLLKNYAMSQGWSVHKVYSDDDYSGLDRNRPEFIKMISDAKEGLFNVVLCKTQSRFTRDMEMVEKYIHGLFIVLGIRFVSIVDNVDTSVKGNKKARQIYGLINEWYCEDLSDNIRAVFKKKMEDGQFLGSFAPYGYMKNPQNRHELCIDHEAAEVVKEIYNLYLKGYGYQYIAGLLTKRGVPTPTVYKKDRGLNFANPNSGKYSENYGVWPANTIRRILTNKVYIGCLIQGRERKVSYKSNKVIIVPENEWVVIENNHNPIIDEKDFYSVQGLISRKRTVHKPKNGYKGEESAYILAGKLKCLDCGSNMQKASPTRDKTTFYLRCSLANKTKSRECSPHSVKLNTITSVIEDKIRTVIFDYLSDGKDVEALKYFLYDRDGLKKNLDDKTLEIKAINKKREEIARMLTAAFVDKTKGIISELDFINMKKIFNENDEKLAATKMHLEEEVHAAEMRFYSTNDVDMLVKKHACFETLTHGIINDFIDNIQVGTDEIIINWLF